MADHQCRSVLGNRNAMKGDHSSLVKATRQRRKPAAVTCEGKMMLCLVDFENQMPIVKDR